MGFPKQESWSVLSLPSPGDLPHPGIKPGSPALQADPCISRGFFIYWAIREALRLSYCPLIAFNTEEEVSSEFVRVYVCYSSCHSKRLVSEFLIEITLANDLKRWCYESAALNMPANLENSEVATGLEKVSLHSNPKERQSQRMLKLPHNCTHLTHY